MIKILIILSLMLVIPLSANAQTPQSHIILINDMRSGNEEICASFSPQTCYSPSEITINVGDSVTWVNNNPSPDWYTLVGDWGGLSQGSGNDNACDGNGKLGYDMCGVSGNDRTSWTHTFDAVGTFNYHDWIFQNSAQRPEGVVNVVVEPFAPESTIDITVSNDVGNSYVKMTGTTPYQNEEITFVFFDSNQNVIDRYTHVTGYDGSYNAIWRILDYLQDGTYYVTLDGQVTQFEWRSIGGQLSPNIPVDNTVVDPVEVVTQVVDKEVLDLRLRILQVIESIFRIVLE